MNSASIELLARALHNIMERLDPTEDRCWEYLTEHQRDFYRICVETLLPEIERLRSRINLPPPTPAAAHSDPARTE